MGCDRMPLLVWQGLPALPLSIRQEFGTSQVTPSLFCTVTAPLQDFPSSSLNKHWLQRVNLHPLGAALEVSRYLSCSGATAATPELSWGSSWPALVELQRCSGMAEMLVLLCWHHLCGNFPASFILFIDSVPLTVIILEAPQGIAGVRRVTKSTSLGLSSKIRGRVIV